MYNPIGFQDLFRFEYVLIQNKLPRFPCWLAAFLKCREKVRSIMAIHEDLPGVEVTVCLNGEASKEYPAENDDFEHEDPAVVLHNQTWTITNYIEAVTGKPFTIKMKACDPFRLQSPTIGFDVYVDGNYIDGTLLGVDEYDLIDNDWEQDVKGPPSKAGHNYIVKPMRFTEIKSSKSTTAVSRQRLTLSASNRVDKATMRNHHDLMHQVGSIVVEVHQRTALGQVHQPRFEAVELNNYTGEFHEKALVEGNQSHGVTYDLFLCFLFVHA